MPIKLYDYIDILDDEWIVILKDECATEIKTKDVKTKFENSIIKKINTDYSESGDYSIITYIDIG